MSTLSRHSLLATIILERFVTGEQDRVSIRNSMPTFEGFFKLNEDLNKQIRNQLRFLWNENLIVPTTDTKKLQKFQLTRDGQYFLRESIPVWRELISRNQKALVNIEDACNGEFTFLKGFHSNGETKFLNKLLDQRTVSLTLIFFELQKQNRSLRAAAIQKLLFLRYGLSISETALFKYLVELTQLELVTMSIKEEGRTYALNKNQVLTKEQLDRTLAEVRTAKQCLNSMDHYFRSLTSDIRKYG